MNFRIMEEGGRGGGGRFEDGGGRGMRGGTIPDCFHLSKNPVEPLKRTVQVELNPAGCTGYCLPSVLCAPTLNIVHSTIQQGVLVTVCRLYSVPQP